MLVLWSAGSELLFRKSSSNPEKSLQRNTIQQLETGFAGDANLCELAGRELCSIS